VKWLHAAQSLGSLITEVCAVFNHSMWHQFL